MEARPSDCCSVTALAGATAGYWPFCFHLLSWSRSQSGLALVLVLVFELISVLSGWHMNFTHNMTGLGCMKPGYGVEGAVNHVELTEVGRKVMR